MEPAARGTEDGAARRRHTRRRAAPTTSAATPSVPDAYAEAVTLDRDLQRLADAEGLTDEQQPEERQQFVRLAHDLGLEPQQARRLFALLVDARIVTDREPWDRVAARWPAQSRRALREKHGVGADQAAERIEAYIEANPALAARLESGLRLHPDVVRMLDDVVTHAGDGSRRVVQPGHGSPLGSQA